jgi:hypothetical protein
MCVSATPSCRKGDPAKIGMGIVKSQAGREVQGQSHRTLLKYYIPSSNSYVYYICNLHPAPGPLGTSPRVHILLGPGSIVIRMLHSHYRIVRPTHDKKEDKRQDGVETSWSFPRWDTDVVNAHFWAKNRSACGNGYWP